MGWNIPCGKQNIPCGMEIWKSPAGLCEAKPAPGSPRTPLCPFQHRAKLSSHPAGQADGHTALQWLWGLSQNSTSTISMGLPGGLVQHAEGSSVAIPKQVRSSDSGPGLATYQGPPLVLTIPCGRLFFGPTSHFTL